MDISVAQKKFAIGKFVEVIPVHSQTARDISDRFHELYMKVEVFPLKVASALRTRAEPSGIFESIWTGLKMSININKPFCDIAEINSIQSVHVLWQRSGSYLYKLSPLSKNMLQRLETIRFSCAGLLSVDFSFTRPYCRMVPEIHEMSPRATTAAIKEECKDLSERLSGFEDAWHLSLASVPAACDAHLQDNCLFSKVAVFSPNSCIPFNYICILDVVVDDESAC
ncbi:hypothetical protein A0H81_09291 [Grifola frondosa]|uniref:Uncharacterized protein n=1 Tax=Grifola frondosa TaxID=5627 RepID=A0A1C7M3X4_GRIFR|nr:hypothetical protein A0H81_09291 [Grifola frondosa]